MPSLHAEIGVMVAILVAAWLGKVLVVAAYVWFSRRRLAHAQAARAGAGDQVDDGTGHSGAVAPGIDVIATNNFRKSTPQPIVDALPVLPYGDACALHAALRARKSSSSDSDSCRHTTSGPAPPSGVASALQLEADGEVCPICLADSYSAATTVKLLPCGHFYHPCCIDEWLSRDVSCPLCKAAVWAPRPPMRPRTWARRRRPRRGGSTTSPGMAGGAQQAGDEEAPNVPGAQHAAHDLDAGAGESHATVQLALVVVVQQQQQQQQPQQPAAAVAPPAAAVAASTAAAVADAHPGGGQPPAQ